MIYKKPEFWITNISKRGITLHDLNITLMPGNSCNLLDYAHFRLTKQQIRNSLESGSLFQKKKSVIVRKFAPKKEGPRQILISENPLIGARKNAVDVKTINYEELEINDDQYLKELDEEIKNDAQK